VHLILPHLIPSYIIPSYIIPSYIHISLTTTSHHALQVWIDYRPSSRPSSRLSSRGASRTEPALAEAAELGAAASLSLALHARSADGAAAHWQDVARYADGMRVPSAERSFYQAVLSLRTASSKNSASCGACQVSGVGSYTPPPPTVYMAGPH
jgi:hypothetical protein